MELSGLSFEALLWEHKRLLILDAVARSMHNPLEITDKCEAALTTLCEYLPLKAVYVYQSDAQQQILHLLSYHPLPVKARLAPAVQRIGADAFTLEARAVHQRQALLLEDLSPTSATALLGANVRPFFPEARSHLCVPLWFEGSCMGTLSALFDTSIEASSLEAAILSGCATHLTAMLAQARRSAGVLREQSRLRMILDQMPEGVLIAESIGGTITYANTRAAHLLGYSQSSLIGMPFHTFSHSSGGYLQERPLRPWNFALTRAFCGESVHAEETVITRRDGRQFFLLCSSAPLREACGDVLEALVVFQDISSQVQFDQQRSAFVALASHELRTPVAVIQGFTDLLLMLVEQGENLNESIGRQAIDTILQQCESLVHLVDGMLDLTHLGQGSLALNAVALDLIPLIQSVVEAHRRLSPDRQFNLILTGKEPPEPLVGWFDEERLRQILNNLIGNAMKYSPAGSVIEVGMRWHGARPDEVLLWVRDEGIGIAPEELPHIFQRFYRARSLDSSSSGLGLGLFLARELVIRQNGHIWVESRKGEGSTFFLRFPLQPS